jgi:glycosyltransferase involved in cell wall biosynthesis
LLLHDVHKTPEEVAFCHRAVKVFAANAELCAKLQDVRPDALAAFAPGAAEQKKSGTFDLTLITFGMAHKIRSDRYKKLGQLLRGDARSAQLEISTALHEGTSFSEEFFSVNTEISEAFEGNVSFLGFLADGEVSRRIVAADALVAFFPKGARENNTTVLSAMAHGCCVITNLDEGSPSWMKHNESVLDIDQLKVFPSAEELRRVGTEARVAVSPYSFKHLAALLNQ